MIDEGDSFKIVNQALAGVGRRVGKAAGNRAIPPNAWDVPNLIRIATAHTWSG